MIFDLAALPQRPRFDERIFLYYEDAELCIRLGKQGVRTFITRECLVSHSGSAVTSRQQISKYRHATFGKLYLLHRHATTLAVVINVLRFYARASIHCLSDHQQAIGRVIGTSQYLLWAAFHALDPRHRCNRDQPA